MYNNNSNNTFIQCESKQKFTPRKLVNYYTSYERVFYPESFGIILCGMSSRLDDQEALFAGVQKSTCAKVAYEMFE